MSTRKAFSGLLLAAACLAAAPGWAVTAPAMSLDVLVEKADIIFIGTVIDRVSAWNQEHTRIYTRTTFRVHETLKGATGETIVVETFGGVVGETGMAAAGMPFFQVNDKELLFITSAPRYGTHHVLGWAQGRFRIGREEGTDRETISRSLAGVSFVGAPPKKMDSIRYLDQLKDAIRHRLAPEQVLEKER